jgi:hypothetical protein
MGMCGVDGGGKLDSFMDWYSFDDGASIGGRGSEGGVIVRDEEHDAGARITLEHSGHIAPFSITCGIYGWMFHTRFFGTAAEAQDEFTRMREALGGIAAAIPLKTDPEVEAKSQEIAQRIEQFVENFP